MTEKSVETTFRVELRHLTAGYDTPLIRDLSLQAGRGEILTLIGPNGAGKSTLLKTLAGRLRPMDGAILYDGADASRLTDGERARKISVMLTERPRPERMTCRELVRTGRYPYTGRLGILTKADRKAADDAIHLVGAEAISDRDWSSISDGQKQKVLLARAICQEPDILLLDEPTSYLDIHHKVSLLEILRKLARETGVTVIQSLHEIDLAQKVSDRVLCVGTEGDPFCGTPEEVFRGDRIAALYHMTEGTYDALTGSMELPRPAGRPRVLVLSGGGTGIPVYHRLQRAGIPFAAGILWENDMDFRAARQLAAEVVGAPAFSPAPEEAVRRMRELMDLVDTVIDCGFPEGPFNRCMADLREEGAETGKLKNRETEEPGS